MGWRVVSAFGVVCMLGVAHAAEVTMQVVSYGGWPNCVRLTNGSIELIVTTDVGPRVIRFGFVGGQNLFAEYETMAGKTGGEGWRIYGGHRLWHAPEAMPRTYAPDNGPVDYTWDGKTLKLVQPVEASTGIQKEMGLSLDPNRDRVEVLHRLINHNLWEVKLAPWALTVMAKGGRAIFPQEAYRRHEEYLLPARALVLWHYTVMTDPRWKWGEKYIQLRQDPSATTPQKVGIMNKPGWAAYALNGQVFIKRFAFLPEAVYPDFGCNTETFTNADMLEIESLGPMTALAPEGGSMVHLERWYLFRGEVGHSEAEIERVLMPLVRETELIGP